MDTTNTKDSRSSSASNVHKKERENVIDLKYVEQIMEGMDNSMDIRSTSLNFNNKDKLRGLNSYRMVTMYITYILNENINIEFRKLFAMQLLEYSFDSKLLQTKIYIMGLIHHDINQLATIMTAALFGVKWLSQYFKERRQEIFYNITKHICDNIDDTYLQEPERITEIVSHRLENRNYTAEDCLFKGVHPCLKFIYNMLMSAISISHIRIKHKDTHEDKQIVKNILQKLHKKTITTELENSDLDTFSDDIETTNNNGSQSPQNTLFDYGEDKPIVNIDENLLLNLNSRTNSKSYKEEEIEENEEQYSEDDGDNDDDDDNEESYSISSLSSDFSRPSSSLISLGTPSSPDTIVSFSNIFEEKEKKNKIEEIKNKNFTATDKNINLLSEYFKNSHEDLLTILKSNN